MNSEVISPIRKKVRGRRFASLWSHGLRALGMCALLLAAHLLAGGLDSSCFADEPTGASEEPPPPPTPTPEAAEVAPRLILHGFADVTFSALRSESSNHESFSEDTFALGALDLYLVSHLAENISFLSEVVFEGDLDGNSHADVERLSLKYTVSDRFWVSMGRIHTALGYWNETYHHGLILQPTVERPAALRFEDDGGILPVHSVGLAMGGSCFRDRWGLSYSTGFANTRGLSSEKVQNGADRNDMKAVTLNLTVSRDADSRLLFGPIVHLDTIPADPLVLGREGRMSERILGAHLFYKGGRFEVQSEIFNVLHKDQKSEKRYTHPTFFAIAVWNAGKWKPYVGYDRLDFDDSDPFYTDRTSSLKRNIAGVRWDLHPLNALKFEYRHDQHPGVRTDVLAIQSAFTF